MLRKKSNHKSGIATVEYLLLMTTVVAVVMIGLKTHIPAARESSDFLYNRVTIGILGKPNPCGDGICSDFEIFDNGCPADCP